MPTMEKAYFRLSSIFFKTKVTIVHAFLLLMATRCDQVYVRKELRDMTPREIARFQAAVAELRFSEDRTWEQFRDLYMYHVMHATGGLFFLPWQRAFLRQMEQRLQEIDCSIVLPYSDFTTDVGFFEEAILWQPSYFGGNGDGRCVEDHRFGNTASWKPCVVRNFNTSIQLPTQVRCIVESQLQSFLLRFDILKFRWLLTHSLQLDPLNLIPMPSAKHHSYIQ